MRLFRSIQNLLTGAVLAAITLAQPLSLAAADRCLSLCDDTPSCERMPPVCGSCSCGPVACCDPLSESDADPTDDLRVRCLVQGCTLLCPPAADKTDAPSTPSALASDGAGLGAPMGFTATVPVAATGDPPTVFQSANATERRALTCVWTT